MLARTQSPRRRIQRADIYPGIRPPEQPSELRRGAEQSEGDRVFPSWKSFAEVK